MRANVTKLLVFLFLAVLLQMCGKKVDETVAIVGDKVITLSELRERFGKVVQDVEYDSASDSLKMAQLDNLINDKIFLIDAYNKNYDQDSVMVSRLNNNLKTAIANKVFEKEVTDYLVPEAEVKEQYEMQKKEIRISDILLRYQKNDSVDTESDIQKMIERIHDYLKDGAAFDSLARRYSQDRVTANKGGDRGFIRWKANSSEAEVFKVAYGLKEGEISKPFKTNNYYHIIRVEEIKETNQNPYEIEKREIVNQMLRKKYKEMDTRKNEVYEQLIEKYNGKFNDENISFMVDKINNADTVEDSIRLKQHLRPDMFSNFTDEDTVKALFEYSKDRRFTIGNMINVMKGIEPNRRPQLKTEAELKNILDRIIIFDMYAFDGKQRGFDKDETVVDNITRVKEGDMLRRYRIDQINNKIEITDEELHEFYEKNKMNYMNDERRGVREIWITEKDLADKAWKEIQSGKSLKSVARIYNERATTKKNDGYLGLIKEQQFGAIGKKAFRMNVGDVSGIIKMGRNFSIFTLEEIQPESPKTFEEAKFQVRNELRTEKRTERENALLQQLREGIKIKIMKEKI